MRLFNAINSLFVLPVFYLRVIIISHISEVILFMKIVAERLRLLREGLHVSQKKIATMIGTTQSTINRYEMEQSFPSGMALLWYADYFDVSLDYIFGRTDNPQGKLYNYQPQVIMEKAAYNADMKEFIEMCFDPNSAVSERLKSALLKMLEEAKDRQV